MIEAVTPAVYHAASSRLKKLDGLLHSFLFHMQISEVEAFTHFNMAPLSMRREVAMLGLLH